MWLATGVSLLWAVHIREAAAVQADRSGKVLIEKLRNTIKVGFVIKSLFRQLWSEILSMKVLSQQLDLCCRSLS